jgi:hypothetical protein
MNQAKVEGQTIEDGDLVLVRQQDRGALEKNRGRTRRLRGDNQKTNQRPRLLRFAAGVHQPNRPIIVAQDFRVQGVVCKVFKRGGELLQSVEQ